MWNSTPSEPGKAWKYAGAVDIPLSTTGVKQAMDAGAKLRDIPLDVVYCSMLIRAQTTALISLAAHNSQQAPMVVRDTDESMPNKRGLRQHTRKMHEKSWSEVIPMYCSNQLNERDFGDVQGVYSTEQGELYSKEQLQAFRCEWDNEFPGGESSKAVQERCVEFYERHILPQLKKDKNVLIVCHGFVIRALIAYLNDMKPDEWRTEMYKEVNKEKSSLHVKNADPLIYSFVKDERLPKKQGHYVKVSGAVEALLGLKTGPETAQSKL